MSSTRQIEANRLNAKKSTGPRTLQGKAVSRFNALKTGIDAVCEIIPAEDPSALRSLSDEYYLRWQPSLPEQLSLVDSLVHNEWLMRRLRKAEARLWNHSQTPYGVWDGRKTPSYEGAVLERSGMEFSRLQRRMTDIEKGYHFALDQLRAMEAEAVAPPVHSAGGDSEAHEHSELADPALPAPFQTVASEPVAEPEPELGFVPPSAIEADGPRPAAEPEPEIGCVPPTAEEADSPEPVPERRPPIGFVPPTAMEAEPVEPAAEPEPPIGFVPPEAPKYAAAVEQAESAPPAPGHPPPQPEIPREMGAPHVFSPLVIRRPALPRRSRRKRKRGFLAGIIRR